MQHAATGDRGIVQLPIPPQDFKNLFCVWLDDDPRRPLEQQLAAACAAYERRFGRSPLIICRTYIRPNQYWLSTSTWHGTRADRAGATPTGGASSGRANLSPARHPAGHGGQADGERPYDRPQRTRLIIQT